MHTDPTFDSRIFWDGFFSFFGFTEHPVQRLYGTDPPAGAAAAVRRAFEQTVSALADAARRLHIAPPAPRG